MERLGTYGMMTITLLALVVAWGSAAWLAAEAADKRNELRMHIEERNTVITRNELAQAMRGLARDTSQQRAELSAIVAEPDVVSMIRTLEQAAAAAGVSFTVESVAPGTFQVGARPADVLPAAVLSVRGEGSFSAVYRFLSLSETMPVAAVIDSANLERLESGAWRIMMRVRAVSEAVSE